MRPPARATTLLTEDTQMTPLRLERHSLKTRITLTTLSIFVISIWILSLYTSRMLREDMERLLGEQQFSTASFIAAQVDE